VEEALVSGERRVVEAPVREVVVGGVAVPVGGWEMEGELHPVPLRLVVAELGPHALAGVGADGDEHANKDGGEGYQEGSRDGRHRGLPWETRSGGGRIWGGSAGFLRPRHWNGCGSRNWVGAIWVFSLKFNVKVNYAVKPNPTHPKMKSIVFISSESFLEYKNKGNIS
jgi:hypothetical protein